MSFNLHFTNLRQWHINANLCIIVQSAYSTCIAKRIVVYSKKNVKPTKKKKEKQKKYILILLTFLLHLQVIIAPRWRVKKLIFCTPPLTIGFENCLLLLFIHTMLVSFVLVPIHVFINKL